MTFRITTEKFSSLGEPQVVLPEIRWRKVGALQRYNKQVEGGRREDALWLRSSTETAVKPMLKTVTSKKPELPPFMLLTHWASKLSISITHECGFSAIFMSRKSPSCIQYFRDYSEIPIPGYGDVSHFCAWTTTSINFFSPSDLSDNQYWENKET